MKNIDILIKLAHLKPEERIHKVFKFSAYNYFGPDNNSKIPNCGTAGCLLGELPGITKDWVFNSVGDLIFQISPLKLVTLQVAEYFDIDVKYIRALFFPSEELEMYEQCKTSKLIKGAKDLNRKATMYEVQENLKLFLTNLNIEHHG